MVIDKPPSKIWSYATVNASTTLPILPPYLRFPEKQRKRAYPRFEGAVLAITSETSQIEDMANGNFSEASVGPLKK